MWGVLRPPHMGDVCRRYAQNVVNIAQTQQKKSTAGIDGWRKVC